MRIARAGVLAFGAIAYVQAIRAEGVFELVESASAFGSAGTLVTVCFGLFTTLGGPVAAMLTLAIGVVSYLVGLVRGLCIPVPAFARTFGADVRDDSGDGAHGDEGAACLSRTTSWSTSRSSCASRR